MAGRPTKLEKISECKNFLIAEGFEVVPSNTHKCAQCGKYQKLNKTEKNTDGSIKALASDNFYKTSLDMFGANGVIPICKTCIDSRFMQHCIESKDDKKFAMYKLCQELNIPWIEAIWKMAVESKNSTHKTFFQKLNSLPQYNGLSYKDSDEYEGELDESLFVVEDKKMEKRKYNETWMGTYSKTEIKYLDDYLENLKSDFNIVTTNHIDYAKKIAKASLIMDKEYEKIINGEGSDASYEKYKRIYDDLCKSAQFAESGRGKTAVGNGISEIVELVENKQWIFKRDDYEKDDIDLLLAQFANISKSL